MGKTLTQQAQGTSWRIATEESGTVTIPLGDYEELKRIEKRKLKKEEAYKKRKLTRVIHTGGWVSGSATYYTDSEAVASLVEQLKEEKAAREKAENRVYELAVQNKETRKGLIKRLLRL